MSARWLIAGALLAAAIASLAVFFGGGASGRDPSASKAGSAAGAAGEAAGGDGEVAKDEDQRPPLPAPVRMRSSGGGANTPYEPFESEERDPGWAPEKEELVAGRVRPILPDGVDIESLQCRTRRCRLAVSGTDPEAFVTFVDTLQDERGFLGIADRLMLRNLDRGEESSSVEVYLLFEADQGPPKGSGGQVGDR